MLGLERVGVDDSFFHLGGDSLLAMRVIASVNTSLDADLEVRTLFDAPTIAQLAPRINAQTSRRKPLLAGDRPEVIPLSFAQSRMWFRNRFEGGVATYNIPTALRIHGPLDVEALGAALDDVIARHESLRTVFPDIDGVPSQEVLPARAGMWRRGGAAVVSVPDRDVAGELVALAVYRFDLSTEVPIRAQIYAVGPEQYVLGIVLHHIAFDGWSLAPMVRDVGEAYRARRQGRAPQWAPLPVQYADYTLWQQEWLGVESDPDSVIAGQLAYWRQELADLPEVVSLPADRARPPVPSYRGDAVEVCIDPPVWAGVKALAAEHDATASMVLQAVMAVVLHRAGAGEDVAMGTPIAGRQDEALDDLVGFFVNTWVLRVGVNSAHRFSEVLEQVRHKALDAYSNQDVPFELLVEQLNPVRSTAHHPLFQVIMAFQNNVRPEMVALEGVGVEPLAADTRTAKFDLDIQLSEVPTEDPAAPMAAGAASYATDLYDRSTIDRLVAWFGRVIEAVIADASVVVGDVALLDRGERDLVLSRWSGAGVGAPVGVAPQLLATAVAADPDAVAVIDGTRKVSYRELDEWSTRLARLLIDAGVGPERAVGVAMDRCVERVVAWWAVVKAGGVFVPVDQAHPVERIAAVLDAVAAVCVLSCGSDTAAGAGKRPVVRIDGLDVSRWNAEAITDADRLAALGVDNTAYVIFTSGSTGAPKGVAVTHAGLLGWVAAQRVTFGLGADARVLMVSAPTFDASICEWLLAVGLGAALVVAPPGVYAGEPLTALLQSQRVNAAFLTPTVLSSLDRARLDGFDKLMIGGEACPAELVAAWAPGRRMFNVYGPTETTIWVTAAPLSAGQRVSIGAPIPGVCALVLDARLNPAPVGVVGELYVGGPALAQGYMGRVDLTAERFVANPFGDPGTRMYRTGDLMRWTRDGTLDFVGRADSQIKVRGQRIELGEIENTLLTCPHVTQAAVTVHDSATGSHLVADVTLDRNTSADHDVEKVEEWQHLYDDLYGENLGPRFGIDFRGWNSSYTGDPIPLEEMIEWRAATVDRIMGLRPRRVLEIGAGSGLVLSQIAPRCEHYVGTDMSAVAIDTLARSLEQLRPAGPRVEEVGTHRRRPPTREHGQPRDGARPDELAQRGLARRSREGHLLMAFVIDVDSHVYEPPEIWDRYVAEEFRGMARSAFYHEVDDEGNRLIIVNGASGRDLNRSRLVRQAIWRPGQTVDDIGALDPDVSVPINPGRAQPRRPRRRHGRDGRRPGGGLPHAAQRVPPVGRQPAGRGHAREGYNGWVWTSPPRPRDSAHPVAILPLHSTLLARRELDRIAEKGFTSVVIRPAFYTASVIVDHSMQGQVSRAIANTVRQGLGGAEWSPGISSRARRSGRSGVTSTSSGSWRACTPRSGSPAPTRSRVARSPERVSQRLGVAHTIAEPIANMQDADLFVTTAFFHGLLEDLPTLRLAIPTRAPAGCRSRWRSRRPTSGSRPSSRWRSCASSPKRSGTVTRSSCRSTAGKSRSRSCPTASATRRRGARGTRTTTQPVPTKRSRCSKRTASTLDDRAAYGRERRRPVQTAGPAEQMIYELRIYPSLSREDARVTSALPRPHVRLFEKHGITNVAYWTTPSVVATTSCGTSWATRALPPARELGRIPRGPRAGTRSSTSPRGTAADPPPREPDVLADELLAARVANGREPGIPARVSDPCVGTERPRRSPTHRLLPRLHPFGLSANLRPRP